MYKHYRSYWWYKAKSLFIQTYLSFLPTKRKLHILDAGCGAGTNLDMLRLWGNVQAMDVSPIAVALCKKQGYDFVIKASLNKLPYNKNSFDVITLFDVLYHKNIRDDITSLTYLRTYLKSGGHLLITDCAFQFLFGSHDKRNHAKTRYTRAELIYKLRISGFTIIRCSYIFCLTFPIFILSRLLEKLGFFRSIKSEYSIPIWINNTLILVERLENIFLRYCDFPFGSSIIILAKKS